MNRYMRDVRTALAGARMMRPTRIEKKLGLAIGLGIGVILGAIATALLVPRTGAETRARLRLGANRLRSRTSETAQRLVSRAGAAAERAERVPEQRESPGQGEIGVPRTLD